MGDKKLESKFGFKEEEGRLIRDMVCKVFVPCLGERVAVKDERNMNIF